MNQNAKMVLNCELLMHFHYWLCGGRSLLLKSWVLLAHNWQKSGSSRSSSFQEVQIKWIYKKWAKIIKKQLLLAVWKREQDFSFISPPLFLLFALSNNALIFSKPIYSLISTNSLSGINKMSGDCCCCCWVTSNFLLSS